MAEKNDTGAGVVSSVAAGILIIALTAMAFVAFEPAPAASMRAAFDTSAPVVAPSAN